MSGGGGEEDAAQPIIVDDGRREGDLERYSVRVAGRTFNVSVSDAHARQLAPTAAHRDLVRESFAFLLEHEPVSSILATFDLTVIARYFPGYPEAMRRRCR